MITYGDTPQTNVIACINSGIHLHIFITYNFFGNFLIWHSSRHHNTCLYANMALCCTPCSAIYFPSLAHIDRFHFLAIDTMMLIFQPFIRWMTKWHASLSLLHSFTNGHSLCKKLHKLLIGYIAQYNVLKPKLTVNIITFTSRSQKNMPLYHSIHTKLYEAIMLQGSLRPNILILGLV